MGASVSVCNLTFIAINVALKQLGPLYYANHLMPNNCTTFKPGKVWFTVEAKIWKNGTNDYTDAMAALPIVGLHQAVGNVVGIGNAIATVVQLNKDKEDFIKMNRTDFVDSIDQGKKAMGIAIGVGFIPTVAIGTAGVVVNEIDRNHENLFVKKMNVLMKSNMRIEIRGGPPLTQVTVRKNYQYVAMEPDFDKLSIEIP